MPVTSAKAAKFCAKPIDTPMILANSLAVGWFSKSNPTSTVGLSPMEPAAFVAMGSGRVISYKCLGNFLDGPSRQSLISSISASMAPYPPVISVANTTASTPLKMPLLWVLAR